MVESEANVKKLEKVMRSKSAVIGSKKVYQGLIKSNTVAVDHYDLNHAKNSFLSLMSTLSPKNAGGMKSAKKSPVKRYFIRSVSPKVPDNNRVSILDRYKHSYAKKDLAKITSGLQAQITNRE